MRTNLLKVATMTEGEKNNMAVYNIQALADRTRYLTSVQGLSQEEAEAKVFKEAGLTGTDALPSFALEAYNQLLSNPTINNEFARHDNEQILNRQEAGKQASDNATNYTQPFTESQVENTDT